MDFRNDDRGFHILRGGTLSKGREQDHGAHDNHFYGARKRDREDRLDANDLSKGVPPLGSAVKILIDDSRQQHKRERIDGFATGGHLFRTVIFFMDVFANRESSRVLLSATVLCNHDTNSRGGRAADCSVIVEGSCARDRARSLLDSAAPLQKDVAKIAVRRASAVLASGALRSVLVDSFRRPVRTVARRLRIVGSALVHRGSRHCQGVD